MVKKDTDLPKTPSEETEKILPRNPTPKMIAAMNAAPFPYTMYETDYVVNVYRAAWDAAE